MSTNVLVRIVDVQQSAKGCRVAYAFEDNETFCTWQGPSPGLGDVYLIDPAHPGQNAKKISSPDPGAYTPGCDALKWRKPVAPAAEISRMQLLRQRHAIRRAVRDALDGQGFTEIEAPLLVHGASPDIAIDSFKINDRYLVSSTEYQMKRLAVGGFTKIYSLTKNFRAGDISRVRNPEFTMLEWGRVGGTMRQIETDAEDMVSMALDALKLPPKTEYQGRAINLKAPWDRIPVLDAVERLTGVSIASFDAAACRRAAEASGLAVRPEWADNRDFLFSLLMDHIQPRLGEDKPVFLTEWPIFQTTSAGADPSDPTRANRSELFICGLEIADGFAGLADAALQTHLFAYAQSQRAAQGKAPVDVDDLYVKAMRQGCPYGAGMALGFDRLAMLLTNQPEIRSVLAFAWDEI